MKHFIFILSILLTIGFSSCRKDFETRASNGNLAFSDTTVYLDTVFTNIGSSTYNLRVYNHGDDAIHIPTVALGQGENSYYRLNIDGIAGKVFENIEIPAKDSIYVFVETTVDITDLSATALEFLYEDQIQFDTGSNQQNVDLVTLIRDATFLFPADLGGGVTETLNLGLDSNGDPIVIDGFVLDATELNWTNTIPYVIYGYAQVAPGDLLSIDSGARIHFHADSGIIVGDGNDGNNASIQTNGAFSTDQEVLEGEIIFEGDRLEPAFSDVPGQWGTIWLTNGTNSNSFNFTTIKNAAVGLRIDNNNGSSVAITNSQIYNSSNFGIWAQTAMVTSENLVINNSGLSSLFCSLGGTYNFTHCTFANYWNNSFRQYPAVLLENFFDLGDGSYLSEDLNANFLNCIIYGNEAVELNVNTVEDNLYALDFKNSLVKFNDFNSQYPSVAGFISDPSNVLNSNPDFRDSGINDMIIGENSGANGISTAFGGVDILTIPRTDQDAGAYQHIIFD